MGNTQKNHQQFAKSNRTKSTKKKRTQFQKSRKKTCRIKTFWEKLIFKNRLCECEE